MPTNSLRKKTKFYTNKKKRNLQMVKTFKPSSGLEYTLKHILLTETFENSIVLVEERIMPFIFVSLQKLVKTEGRVRSFDFKNICISHLTLPN